MPQSDGEKSDQDLIVDDGSDGPASPVMNGRSSPRENGIGKISPVAVSSLSATGVSSAVKKDALAPPHSPRSGTSSNASTPSAKNRVEEREKPMTPISKPLTPTSGAAAVISNSIKSSTPSSKLLQGPPVPPGVIPPPAVTYPGSLHYPPPGPPHNLVAAVGQHPHVDMMAYNGYATPRPPASLHQLYDPHSAMRAPVGSIAIPGGKP